MESKRTLAPSVRGDPAGLSTARALSPAPSGRFSLRRVSLSSSRASMASGSTGSTSASTSPVINEDSSCVAQETALGDSARYCFITWAAVKRNECERMTDSERLECPLLRCRQRFSDHERMLRHLASCDHLGTCEYWCYEHMKVERFDDAKSSKRCLTQPSSKRRKMIVMAKSFFSSLGHKGRRSGVSGTLSDSDFGVGGSPSMISVDDLPDVDPSAGAELSGTEIVEIDSTEVISPSQQPLIQDPAPSIRAHPTPEQAGRPNVVNPQVLSLPELESSTGTEVDDSFMNWQPSDLSAGPDHAACPGLLDPPVDWLDTGGVSPLGSPAPRPPLQVNTYGLPQHRKMVRPRPSPAPPTSRSKDLSPSSSVRSTTSTTSTTSTVSNTSMASATSNVSSLVSPASIWSHDSNMWTEFATHLTSPAEDLVNAAGFLPEDAVFEDAAAAFYDSTCPPPGLLDTIFELPADIPETRVFPENLSSDPLLFAQDAALYSGQHGHSYSANLVIADEDSEGRRVEPPPVAAPSTLVDAFSLAQAPARVPLSQPVATQTTTTSKSSTVSQPSTKSIAGSAWDTLLEHVACSQVKMQKVTNNPLADHLRTLSPRVIAQHGLNALQALLDGHLSTSPTGILCLMHVIYALSVVVYHKNDVAMRCSHLYVQSLVYSTVLSEQAKPFFNQLAAAIWQPTDLSKTDLSQGLLRQYASIRRTPSQKGKEKSEDLSRHIPYQEDPLICTARNFLDDLEFSAILHSPSESPDVATSNLYAKHFQESSAKQGPSITLTAAAPHVLGKLAKKFNGSDDLLVRLKEIFRRVGCGSIVTVRRLELEILQAGKVCLPSSVYFDEFTSAVGHLCDRLYLKYGAGTSQRAAYHKCGIALFDALIADLDSSRAAAALFQQPPTVDGALLLDDAFLKSITPCMANSATDGLLFPFNLDATAMDFSELGVAEHPLKNADGALMPASGMEVGDSTARQDIQVTQPSLSAPATSASSSSSSSSPTMSSTSSPSESAPTASSSSSSLARTEAHDCCDICGYRPKGDPQWFKGSMAKHKKLQHSAAPPKIYKCQFPGCSSQYKNRPDNLRQHQIEKRHFVDGEEQRRRPNKRKKLSA
ncbi:hypothetical protein MAPG_00552 [Magnaporthiopsis poae ATCC 64411]|uniref:C2H2-type domain-containing protein n=1 Tax=Magnaporthiopsis poae (strain ATCC 64411 / 73-15) TaxID=644358 RepID=A0A0C4DLB1_MAGP6|nr:hypothetical protein MAPG_00552 [Magnaporthiopsis poae ATCC 64411]